MIDYSEEWLFLLVFRLKGSLAIRAMIFAVPASLLSLFLVMSDEVITGFGLRESMDITGLDQSQLWVATTAVLVALLGFRTNRAMSRFWEGTGLLHQMRAEWFDAVSNCCTFSRGAKPAKPNDVKIFRHTLVRLMSLCHGNALEELGGESKAGGVQTIDAYGLQNETLQHLKNCKENAFNRVEVLLHMMQVLIMTGLDDGVLKVPPPILSRVFQTLSRGFVHLLNARKIADIRFPFPFAQIITILLLVNCFFTPVMMSTIVNSKIWAPLFTFVPLFAMFYINFVGVELENPFGDDANDLPLEYFQSEMNDCLLMLLHDQADILPSVNEDRCVFDFMVLRGAVESAERCQANFGNQMRTTRVNGTTTGGTGASLSWDDMGTGLSNFRISNFSPSEQLPPASSPPDHIMHLSSERSELMRDNSKVKFAIQENEHQAQNQAPKAVQLSEATLADVEPKGPEPPAPPDIQVMQTAPVPLFDTEAVAIKGILEVAAIADAAVEAAFPVISMQSNGTSRCNSRTSEQPAYDRSSSWSPRRYSYSKTNDSPNLKESEEQAAFDVELGQSRRYSEETEPRMAK